MSITDEEYEFESARQQHKGGRRATGAGDDGVTYPLQCSELRKGDFVVINQRACKIVQLESSKPGKHGHAKIHLIGIDLHRQQKMDKVCPSRHKIQVPVVTRREYQLVNVSYDGALSLMDSNGLMRHDVDVAQEGTFTAANLNMKLEEAEQNEKEVYVTIISALSMEKITDLKLK